MDMKGKHILLYVRVSTDEQARHGESVLDQSQALHKWCEDHGCIIAGEYHDEGFSARKSYRSRPALLELLSAVERGEGDAVVFTKLDRWFRNLKDYYKVQEILEKHGVFWCATLEDYETLTSAGRFKVNLMLSIAEHEADLTSERIKFTFEQKRARGEIVGSSMPRGYKLVNKKPVKDPKTQMGVEAFWKTYFATGRISAAMSAADAFGVHFKYYATAGRMLSNASCYAGTIQGVPCEPYITEEQRDRVLNRRRRSPRRTGNVYLFQGLVKCGTCGGTMGGHQQGYVKQDGTRSAYYSCARANLTRGELCSNKHCQAEDKLERYLLERIEAAIRKSIIDAEKREKEPEQRDDPSKEIASLKAKQSRLTDVYLDGIISKDEYKKRRDAIETELKRLSVVQPPKRKTPDQLKGALPVGWRGIYDRLDTKHRQVFWRGIVSEIRVFDDNSITFDIDD